MGQTQTRALGRNRLFREVWELYLHCRSTSLVIYEMPDRTDKKKTRIVPVVWPTGFSQLPHSGGVQDQPATLMRLLFACLQGERDGVARKMAQG